MNAPGRIGPLRSLLQFPLRKSLTCWITAGRWTLKSQEIAGKFIELGADFNAFQVGGKSQERKAKHLTTDLDRGPERYDALTVPGPGKEAQVFVRLSCRRNQTVDIYEVKEDHRTWPSCLSRR
jgi:hypothetical protein